MSDYMSKGNVFTHFLMKFGNPHCDMNSQGSSFRSMTTRIKFIMGKMRGSYEMTLRKNGYWS